MIKDGRKRILIVEDEVIIALNEARIVKNFGYDVCTVSSGEEAIKSIKIDAEIDLILMDINLGSGFSGPEAAAKILEYRELPIVFLTSHAEKEYVEKVQLITRYGYVLKNSGDFVLHNSIQTAFELFSAKQNNKSAKETSDIKKIESELNETEEIFSCFLEHSPYFIFFKDENAKSLRLSRNFEVMLGKPMSELIGKSMYDLFPSELAKSMVSDDMRIINEGKQIQVDEELNGRFYSTVKFPIITVSGKKYLAGYTTDITEKKLVSDKIKINEDRLKRLVSILQYPVESVQLFLDYALAEAIELTGSKIGYIYYYNEDKKQFTLNTWSKEVMPQCSVANPLGLYDLEKTGIWGEVVRQRKPIVVNDFAAPNPLKKGTPQGHVMMKNFMSVPIFKENKIVLVVGLANKEGDYDEADILQVSLLMDSVWKEGERKISEERIKNLLLEKEVLLKEVHHRIKNNMSTIQGLLSLQARNSHNDAVIAALTDASSRVQSMFLLYEKLFQASNFNDVLLSEYLPELINQIICNFSEFDYVVVRKDIDVVILDAKRLLPLGIIINELITNSMKYAFKDILNPELSVSVKLNNKNLAVIVKDNGVGTQVSNKKISSGGFGLSLVGILVEQLGGALNVQDTNGTEVCINFPYK